MTEKGIRQNGKKWRWECCVNGKRQSGTTDTHQAAINARNLTIQKIQKAAQPIAPAPTTTTQQSKRCPTLLQAINAMKQADWLGAKSLTSIDINCNILLSYFGNERRLNTIATADVDGYISYLRKKGNKGSSINRKLAILSKLLTRAIERGDIEKRPFIQHQAESPGRVRYITPEEEEAILNQLKEWDDMRFYHVIIVLTDTGMRVGELKKLSPEDIQPEQGVHGIVYLNETKNGTSRSVPLTQRAKDSLDILIRTSHDKSRIVDEYPAWITRRWDRVRDKLGYTNDPNFVPHILRHTCCSRLVQKGAPLKKVQLFMGHKNIQTTMRYAHLAPRDIYDMASLLEE